MSVKIMARVWADSKQEAGTLLVALALADFADDQGFCWPSMPIIARKARLSERQAWRCVGKLIEDGELEKTDDPSGGRRSNTYHFIQRIATDHDILTRDIHDRPTLTPMSGQPCHPCQVETVEKQPQLDDTVIICRTANNREPSIEPSIEPSLKPKSTFKPCYFKNDPAYMALIEAEGINLEEVSDSTGRRIANALREIKKVAPSVTATDIKSRAARYRKEWPTCTLTANALAKHWARFAPGYGQQQFSAISDLARP